MTADREQTRRDAEALPKLSYTGKEQVNALARNCLALLAELQQAERERDEARKMYNAVFQKAQARLERVPALVEALRGFFEDSVSYIELREALAAYEQEQT